MSRKANLTNISNSDQNLKNLNLSENLDVSGNVDVTGNVSVSGTLSANIAVSDFAPSGNMIVTGTTTLRGATDIDSTLTVDGTSTLTGATSVGSTLNSSGDLAVGSDYVYPKFKVVASSGNLSTDGTLSADGNLTINTDKFSVVSSNGNTLIGGNLNFTGNKFSIDASNGNTTIAGNVVVGGDKLSVNGSTGNTTIAGDVTVGNNQFTIDSSNGNTSVSGTVTLGDTINLNATTGNSLVTHQNNFVVAASTGNVTSAGTVSMTGDLTVNSNKFIANATSGNIAAAGEASVGSLISSGNLNVNSGKFTVDSTNGNVTSTGNLTMNTDKFIVNGATGDTTAAGDIEGETVTLSGTSGTVFSAGVSPVKLSIDASGGISTGGSLSILPLASGNSITVNNDRFDVDGTTGRIRSHGVLELRKCQTDAMFKMTHGNGTQHNLLMFSTGTNTGDGQYNINIESRRTLRFFADSTRTVTTRPDTISGTEALRLTGTQCQIGNLNASANTFIRSRNGGIYFHGYTSGGTVTLDGTHKNIGISSDVRLKDKVEDYNLDGIEKVKQLKPRYFEWRDNSGRRDLGFIAQELETVIPEAVDGKKYEYLWEIDEDGNPVLDDEGNYQYTDEIRPRGVYDRPIIAVLVKAMQDQQSIIDQLTLRVSALEAT